MSGPQIPRDQLFEVPVPSGAKGSWATLPSGERAFLAFSGAAGVSAWAAKQDAPQATRPLPAAITFGLAKAVGADRVMVDPLGPSPKAVDLSRLPDDLARAVTFDAPASADDQWLNVALRVGMAAMASRPSAKTRQWFFDHLKASRVYLAKEPGTDKFVTPAYQGSGGKVVLTAFSDPPAVRAWVASWSAEPLVYGTMPVRSFVTGLRRSTPPVDIVVLNYGLAPEMILGAPELDELAR